MLVQQSTDDKAPTRPCYYSVVESVESTDFERESYRVCVCARAWNRAAKPACCSVSEANGEKKLTVFAAWVGVIKEAEATHAR